MKSQPQGFFTASLIVMFLAGFIFANKTINGLSISENTQIFSKTSQTDLEETGVKNAIVLIGLDDVAKDFTGYGVIPVSEKYIKNFLNTNSTFEDKLIGDSRNFHWKTIDNVSKTDTDDPDTQSRLLPLITTPKKALLLFALHESLLKSSKSTISTNCIVLSKDDLMGLLGGEGTNPLRHQQTLKKEDRKTTRNMDE